MDGAAKADQLNVQVPRHTRLFVLALVAVAALGLESAAGKPAGAPKLKAAKALDSDRDGSVDAFDLTFSGPVRGKGDARAPFRFKVAGYRVTGAGAPRGRKVRVRVAETRPCDLASRPRVSYRPGAGGLTTTKRRPLRASRVVAGRAARGAPRMVCAATADSDADGHIDAMILGYSKKVRNRAQSSGRLPFQVDRYSVASIGKARGLNLTLRLREKEAYDTDAVPAVIYNSPKAKRERRFAVTGSGGRARTSTFNATRDRAGARPLSTATADSNLNGLVDGVRAQFSEPVRAGGGAAEVAGARVTEVTGGGREILAANIAEGPLNTGDTPKVTLGIRGSLRDTAGNTVAQVSTTAADGAAPVLAGAATRDSDADGRIDALALNFSEPVSHPADSDASYPLSVSGYRIVSAGQASGTALTLSLTEGGAPDSGVRPTVGYARGARGAVTDRAGNEAANRSFGGVGDGAAPVLLGVSLLDADLDGMADAARYDFSEPVVHSAANCPSCSFSLVGYTLGYAGPAAGASVTVAVPGGSGPGTTSATYSPMGGGVRDGGGNLAPGATVPARDASPPVVDSAVTVDNDSDGHIDRIDLAFSEPLAVASEDNAGPFSFGAAGYTVSRVTAPAGDRLSIELQEQGALDTDAAPAISYAGNGIRITDANGVELARRSYPNLTRDGAAPVFMGATTADRDVPAGEPGQIDAVELRYSEDVQATSPPGAFSVDGGARTVGSVVDDPEGIVLRVGEAGTDDSDATPSVSYTPPGAAGDSSRLRDMPHGPGDDADEADPFVDSAADGAGPAIVRTATGEGSTQDGIIEQVSVEFSEPVELGAGSGEPISLSDGLAVTGTAATANPDELSLSIVPDEPNGGIAPQATVTDQGRVTDGRGNAARGYAFHDATDAVRPILVSAQLGETAAASCGTVFVDGSVDCVRGTWSEAVQPVGGIERFTLESLSLTDVLGPADERSFTDLLIDDGGSPGRSAVDALSYTEGVANPVIDLSSNLAIGTTVNVAAACPGPIESPPNDTRADGNDLLTDPFPIQALCAGDGDYFRVPGNGGQLAIAVDPAPTLGVTIRLVDSADGEVAGSRVSSSAPGAQAVIGATLPAGSYWLHVTGNTLGGEGAYCVNPSWSTGETCDDGDATDQ